MTSQSEPTVPATVATNPQIAAVASAPDLVGGLAADVDDWQPEARRAHRPSLRLRFFVAFICSLLVALAVGVGGIYAYDQQYVGRILPGVHVGSVDLSGLDRTAATQRLSEAFASYSQGQLALHSSIATFRIPYADFERAPAVDAMVDEALAVGHGGSVVERALAEARSAVRGVTIAPLVSFNSAKLLTTVTEALQRWNQDPIDATVVRANSAFVTTSARSGRTVDLATSGQGLAARLEDPNAPTELTVDVPLIEIAPQIDDNAALQAQTAATRMATEVSLVAGKQNWTISAASIRSWITFGTTPSTTYAPILNQDKLESGVKKLAKQIDRPAVNASFLTSRAGKIVGVTASADGRKVNVHATALAVAAALQARADGQGGSAQIQPALAVVKPKLSTDEARKAAPLMRKISSWTTWFPIWERNAFGANIWVPALLINGTVVGPGESFDFWNAVGPVTAARGFGQGGAIINGRTDPQGAIGGGICSCSTTLFNAALRAGMQITSRRNHFYYINRYPVGLDATVFISSGGGRTTMSFTNDTAYPVLIRGYKIRGGGKGFVRFEVYSVPNGRRVVISNPTIRNVTHATDTVQYTSSLPAGARQRVEVPVDGMDVWRTVTVYQDGKVLRKTTYYSHYARITGVLLIGTGGS
jgi:vancomycin resistance protein YoaR